MKKSYILNHDEIEFLIPGYPKGYDLTIINTWYVRGNKEEPEYISILFRDNVTGQKHIHTIFDPLYTFYVLKDKRPSDAYPLAFAEKDKTIPCTCLYRDLLGAVAEAIGRLDEYSNGDYTSRRKLLLDGNVLGADKAIENYYRFLFSLSYKNSLFKLSKAFLDIEVDVTYCNQEFPESGSVPINAIAYFDEAHNKIYQLIYNDRKNPLVAQYKSYVHQNNITQELQALIIDKVGGQEVAEKYNLTNLNFEIIFVEDELKLIGLAFQIVHATCPDFIEIWNMSFDLNFFIDRLVALGQNPAMIMCDPRINNPYLSYYVDFEYRDGKKIFKEEAERCDNAVISMYSVWIDQMIQFASRRKGKEKHQSLSLDAIGEEIAKVKKLQYEGNLGDLPYRDMKTFSFYNIMDVVVQKCCEYYNQDLEYLFTKCLVNNTVYPKGHRQSVYLANRFAKDYYENGYIIGDNKNKWNEKPETKFPGALVGNPLHNAESAMVHIANRPTRLADNVIDFDYSSLYPSIILENNLSPHTQIGKVIIEDPNNKDARFSQNEHHDMFSSNEEPANYSRGGEFLENLMSGNPLEFSRRWLHLGDIHQVIEDIEEFEKMNNRPIPKFNIKTEKDIEDIEFKTLEEGAGYSPNKPMMYFFGPNPIDKEKTKTQIEKGGLF